VLEGQSVSAKKADSIDADTFFSVEITVNNKVVNINGIPLTADGKVITTSITENGQVG
jgi:hypothetical protein